MEIITIPNLKVWGGLNEILCMEHLALPCKDYMSCHYYFGFCVLVGRGQSAARKVALKAAHIQEDPLLCTRGQCPEMWFP